jgi:hypothetical protein
MKRNGFLKVTVKTIIAEEKSVSKPYTFIGMVRSEKAGRYLLSKAATNQQFKDSMI